MNNIKAAKRDNTSTGFTRNLRQKGLIPAVLYGGKLPNSNLSLEKKKVISLIKSDTFLSKVIEIEVDGKKEKVIPREVSYNVVSDEPIHIDLMRIITGSKIIIEIPVKFINQEGSPGLKKGGVLNIVRRKVELKCPADKIPENLVVNLDGTEIGTSIKISSIKLPENVIPTITDRDFVVATVASPTVIKEPEKPADQETATEGAEGEAVEGAETQTGAKTADGKAAETAKDDKSKDQKSKEQGSDKKSTSEKKPTEKK